MWESKPCRVVHCYKYEDKKVSIIGFDGVVKLNLTGSIIWKLCDGKHTVLEIVNELLNVFQIMDRERVYKDVKKVLSELHALGLVILDWDPLYKDKLHLIKSSEACTEQNVNVDNNCDILLINSPSAYPGSMLSQRLQGMPPLGLGYIATWLSQNNYNAKILDLYIRENTILELEKILIHDNPAIIGISTTTESYNTGIRIAKFIKDFNNNIIILMGGSHVTFMYEEPLLTGYVDVIARNEGEYTIKELCDYFIKHQGSLEDIKGIVYIKNKQIIKNPRQDFIWKLDKLPYPDRRLFELEKYSMKANVSTSRGCPGACIFCAATALSGGKYRIRSAENIINEIKYLKSLGNTHIQIVDDTLTADVERLERFINLLIESDLGITWNCESRVDIMTKELLLKMKESGCISIQFGVEAATQEMLDSLKKNITIEQIKNVFGWCKDLKINTTTCLIIGQPYDTTDSIRSTIEFGKDLQAFGAKVVFSVSTPYPGTYMLNHPDKLGLKIYDRDWDNYTTQLPVYDSQYMSGQEIQKYFFDGFVELGKGKMNDDARSVLKGLKGLLKGEVLRTNGKEPVY